MGTTRTIVFWTDQAVRAFSCAQRAGKVQIVGEGRALYPMPDSLLAAYDSSTLTAATIQALEQTGGLGAPVSLILPMHWCFLQTIKTSTRRPSHESLGYELEPFLPMPLEEVTCAFERLSDDTYLGAAIPTGPMKELLEKLSTLGAEVDCIGIDVLVAAQLYARDRETTSLAVSDARWLRALILDPAAHSLVTTALTADQVQPPKQRLRVRLRMVEDIEDLLDNLLVVPIADFEEGNMPEAPAHATNHLRELSEFVVVNPPALDLATGALAGTRKSLELGRRTRQCLGLAATLFFVMAAGMFFEVRALGRHERALDSEKLSVFQEVFPTSTLPPSAAMRLASERVRLEGLSRVDMASSQSKEPLLPAPFDVLRNIVEALPPDVPVLLQETRIDERQLTLRGQTREHRDAERIVEAINKVPGIKALAPRTNRLKAGGVEFAINAGADHGQ